MVQAAQACASEMGIEIAVAVIGSDGAPMIIDRMDGATAVSVGLAMGKARAAFEIGRPSAEVGEQLKSLPQLTAALIAQFRGEFVAVGGALPLLVRGRVVGSVGASGGSSVQDVQCATAAADLFHGSGETADS
jgi:uncharacterized protein GlcG (DUF336 family)